MKIEFKNVSKSFEAKNSREIIEAISDVSFNVKKNEIFCLVGPSGCGKSTLINLAAGFIKTDRGEVFMDNEKILDCSSKRTVVFQEHAIFPWKTVKENIAFGLKCKNMSQDEIEAKVEGLLKKTKLEAFANRYPDELSGGMKQRVAIARAFAVKPDVILMDEPFASLDQQNRDLLQEELLNIHDEIKQTIIFVTHNIDEAVFLGDRIAVMTQRPAKIREIIKVDYKRPRLPEIRNQEKFLSLKEKIWKMLREEIS